MTAASSTSCCATAASEAAEINASCRVPLFVLFIGGAFWLFVASVLGLIASIKFHSPGFLADCSFLTYGRVHPAATNALLYGFAIQTGLGALLWIFAQQGKTPLVHPLLMGAAGKLWNLGVLLGLAGILRGSSTGYENLEMPMYAACILFAAYVLIAILAMITLRHRTEKTLHPAQWFLLTALFWFPWIYSTANLLLLKFPVRGVTQAIIAWWFSGNLMTVWLALVGIAALFYLVPKILDRPLYSTHFALFAFWTLLVFGSWTGIPSTAPLPAWMPALSAVATVMCIIPVLAVLNNICRTIHGECTPLRSNPSGRFIQFALPAFLLVALMALAGALPGVTTFTTLTSFTVAQSHLQIYGFFAMAMFAVAHYAVPRIAGIDTSSCKMAKIQFFLTAFGILFLVIPLAIGGVIQGIKLNNPAVNPVDIAKSTIMFLRIATLGELLIALGNFLFFVKLLGLAAHFARKNFLPFYADATCEEKIAEAKA